MDDPGRPVPPPSDKGSSWGCWAVLAVVIGVIALTVPEDLHGRFSGRQCEATFCWRTDTTPKTVTYDIIKRRSGQKVGSSQSTVHVCPAHAGVIEQAGLVTAFIGYFYIALFMCFIGGALYLVDRAGGPSTGVEARATWYPPGRAAAGLAAAWFAVGSAAMLSMREFGKPMMPGDNVPPIGGWILGILAGIGGLLSLAATLGRGGAYMVLLGGTLTLGPVFAFSMDEVVPMWLSFSLVGISGTGMLLGVKSYGAWAGAREKLREQRVPKAPAR